MGKSVNLTQEYIRSILHYDPLTGKFFWKYRADLNKSWNTKHAGKETGTQGWAGKNKALYVLLRIDDVLYKAHRIAWLYINGGDPITIDHIDGNGINNKLTNLRAATRSQNQCNRGLQSNNTSGVKGVSWSKPHQKWASYIKINNKKKHLGLYNSLQEAELSRALTAKNIHGEFARLA